MDKQALKKWTHSPPTLILLGLAAYLRFRPPAGISEENPVSDRFWKAHRDRGFKLIPVSVDDTPEKITNWMQGKDYVFMADADGRIRHKIAGQVHDPRLDKLVLPFLAEATPP